MSLHQPHSVELRYDNDKWSVVFFLLLSFVIHFALCFCVWSLPVHTLSHITDRLDFGFLFIVTLFASRFYVSHITSSFHVHFHSYVSLSIPFHCVPLARFTFVRSSISLFSFRKFNWISTRIKKTNVVNFLTWIWMHYYFKYYLTGRLITQIKFDNLLEQLCI